MANIILTPKPLRPLQQVMLLRVKWAGAAGGWGGAAGGGARPVAQLDPGAHICPRLPILRSLLRLSLGQLLGWTISWPWVEPCMGFSSLLPHYWLLPCLQA